MGQARSGHGALDDLTTPAAAQVLGFVACRVQVDPVPVSFATHIRRS